VKGKGTESSKCIQQLVKRIVSEGRFRQSGVRAVFFWKHVKKEIEASRKKEKRPEKFTQEGNPGTGRGKGKAQTDSWNTKREEKL